MGKRASDTSFKAVVKSQTNLLVIDHDFDLQDAVGLDDVVELLVLESIETSFDPRIYPNKVIYIRSRLNNFR
jgi:hypothetical protein